MGRFVKPEVIRLSLSDVYKQRHQDLVEHGVNLGGDPPRYRPATLDELTASEQCVAAAVADGDFIDVKRRLNTGEQQDMFAQIAPTMTPNQPIQLQSRQVMTAKVLAYLLGWSLTDDGVPVPVSADALKNLDPDTFAEIREAIDTHEAAVEQAIADAKNGRGGKTASKTPSVSAVR